MIIIAIFFLPRIAHDFDRLDVFIGEDFNRRQINARTRHYVDRVVIKYTHTMYTYKRT